MNLKYIFSLLFIVICSSFINGQQAYLDNFGTVSYGNNDGNQNFSSNWIEENDDNNAGSGAIQVYGPFQQLLFNQLPNLNRRIRRSVNLAGATTVKLSFTYNAISRGNESLAVQLWNNTTGQWNNVFNINQSNSNRISITLTADQISANSQIRFESTSGGWNSGEYILIDDIMFYNYDDTIPLNVPLELIEQFNGNYDYSVTGGTLRNEEITGDPCTLITSSSNQLTSPVTAGATVERAFLYWAHSNLQPDTQVVFEGQNVNAEIIYASDIIPGRIFYGYVSDVTSIVKGVADVSSNNFDFSGLDISTNDIYCGTSTVLGGWTLMVFYDDPNIVASSINLYQGFDGLSNAGTTFTLDSFFAIGGTGSKATFLSWEGDSGLNGSSSGSTNPEELSITNQLGFNYVLSGDGGQTGNNVYNSTIYDQFSGVNLSNVNGLDLDTYDISSYIFTSNNQVTANVDVGQDFIISNAVVLKVPSNLITGRVFEDLNYPGGNGRNWVNSSGVLLSNVTVQLFDAIGNLLETTTTNSKGVYSFGGMANGSYSIRVLNQTVLSSRGGGAGCATCYGVQTFKRSYNGSSYIETTTQVGGSNPSAANDANPGTLNGAQSVSQVLISSTGITGIDFGFNFNTIVNTNVNGQGSLEQFILNSNNLDEAGLDIEANSIFNPAAGDDTSIFMIPPTGDALGRAADVNFTSGYFNILISSGNPLTIITGGNTKVDGRTQTAYSGDTNSGVLGSGGSTVGVSNVVLPNFIRPEIQVHRDNGDVFRTEGDNIGIRNLSIFANSNSGIRVDAGSISVTQNIIGMDATGVTVNDLNIGIENINGNLIADGNYIAKTGNYAISVDGGTSTILQNNHLANNGIAPCDDAIIITGGTGVQILSNLIETSASTAIDAEAGTGSIIISENSLTTSGQNGGFCSGSPQQMAIKLAGDNSEISNNKIYSNGGAGISILGGISNLISQNSIYANGTVVPSLGIDLNMDGVTINDTSDTDSGPNNLENFPVVNSSFISGSNLIVTGWASPGATIEVFFTDINEGTAAIGDNQLGLTQDYGEGQIYIGTGVEGSASDQDTTSSSYSDGDGNTDNTNKYKFILPLPSGTVAGDLITTTGTRFNSTSEFSPKTEIQTYTVITNRNITYRIKAN